MLRQDKVKNAITFLQSTYTSDFLPCTEHSFDTHFNILCLEIHTAPLYIFTLNNIQTEQIVKFIALLCMRNYNKFQFL